jgi:hypothetical protein
MKLKEGGRVFTNQVAQEPLPTATHDWRWEIEGLPVIISVHRGHGHHQSRPMKLSVQRCSLELPLYLGGKVYAAATHTRRRWRLDSLGRGPGAYIFVPEARNEDKVRGWNPVSQPHHDESLQVPRIARASVALICFANVMTGRPHSSLVQAGTRAQWWRPKSGPRWSLAGVVRLSGPRTGNSAQAPRGSLPFIYFSLFIYLFIYLFLFSLFPRFQSLLFEFKLVREFTHMLNA